jgi:uncharacterized membrane protein
VTVILLTDVLRGGGPSVWRFVVGATMVVLVPGYLLAALLFPRSEELDGVERIALACALSVVITIVATLGLAELHVRLDARTDVLTLSGAVFVLLAGALWRRSAVSPSSRYLPRLPCSLEAVLTCCFLVLLGLGTWWIVGTNLGIVEPEFYVSDARGMLAGYPKSVHAGSAHSIYLHVENPDGQAVIYRLRMRDGATVMSWSSVKVGPRTNLVRRIHLPSNGVPRRVRLTFTFFRHNHVSADLRITYRIVS